MWCEKCGKPVSDGAAYCKYCGAAIHQTGGGGYAAEMRKHIGKGAEYYMRSFAKMQTEGRKVSWNWWAFLFGTFWLIYRRIYDWAITLFLFDLLLIYVSITHMYNSILGLFSLYYFSSYDLISLAVCVCFGMFGNYIYMRHIEKIMKNETLYSGIYKERYISSGSGVDIPLVIFALLIELAFAYKCAHGDFQALWQAL